MIYYEVCYKINIKGKRKNNKIQSKGIRAKIEQFKYSVFPFCINEWNKMDNLIKKSAKIKFFKSMLIKLFSLLERSLFSIHDPIGVKLLTTLQFKFSHLYKNKFCHISRILSVLYMTGTEPKTTEHFFLALPHFGN